MTNRRSPCAKVTFTTIVIYHYLPHSLAHLITFFDEIADELEICLQRLLHEHASSWGRSDTLLVGVGGSSVVRHPTHTPRKAWDRRK